MKSAGRWDLRDQPSGRETMSSRSRSKGAVGQSSNSGGQYRRGTSFCRLIAGVERCHSASALWTSGAGGFSVGQ